MTTYEAVKMETGQAVTPETPLSSLDVDSLEFLNLLLVVETGTGRRVPNEKIGSLQTVGDIDREAV